MKFFDRDLSWLSFNYRVLMEAMDKKVPLLERLRFIAIYSSNLDEFFRVRVANIRNIKQINKKKINKRLDFEAEKLLEAIHTEVSTQLATYGQSMRQIVGELDQGGYQICTHSDLIPEAVKPYLLRFFKTKLSAYLKIQPVSKKSELFFDNQAIYLLVVLADGQSYVINIPSDHLPRFVTCIYDDKHYFIFLDDILRLHLDFLFPETSVLGAYSVKLNKDADLQIDDEFSGDLVKKIEKQIQKRNLGIPSRFLYDEEMPVQVLSDIMDRLKLTDDDAVTGGRYHNLNDLFQLSIDRKDFQYPEKNPIPVLFFEKARSLFNSLEAGDRLLHFPYQSYDYVLQFFSEAAIDPEVEEIYVTFYRMAEKSIIGESLISAAKNGKQVSVFMEVKARFDEKNNLDWAQKMKASGIRIIYSLPGLKVHAKVALVKRRDLLYGFFGTGNLNEKTAALYCDHGLFSTDPSMTQELQNLFQHLISKSTPPPFEKLLISQFGAMEAFSAKIDREIAHAEAGKEARIIIKVNNLEERTLIEKLYEAHEKGVDVKLIVRGICCLVSTNGLKVKRIVDRYLEHSRVFYFHDDGTQEIYMGSSDWMGRNMHRRIEVCFPVEKELLKQEILSMLELQWKDDVKGVWLTDEMKNERPHTINTIRSQTDFYAYLLENTQEMDE